MSRAVMGVMDLGRFKLLVQVVGVILILVGVLSAGAFSLPRLAVISEDDPFSPVARFPSGDDPINEYVEYYSGFNEYHYVFRSEGRLQVLDDEPVRVFHEDGVSVAVSYRVHYEWFRETVFERVGQHPVVYFTSGFHTPYVSRPRYLERGLSIGVPLVSGIVLLLVGGRLG